MPCLCLCRARAQSGISVSDALLELYEQVKLRKAHKFVVFSLKKTDTTGRTYEWQIDYTAPPNDDIGANKVRHRG